ncbi:LysR family transcriptional regulator [Falsihalocynthiibacter arcticus]|uniref:HTH lysR-type domain-containing protein n=1 Tax=Falsihalocynthiibacter arcticus TaxID=1579316 RepID=A0A126UYG8_9RHOB|nr:LysR family transcriptional regulator [Falsihalocynthiibacter arcticus]AML50755.1 hypothetical protein RC74_05205 [Falsihalocynthiibacter arcticus]
MRNDWDDLRTILFMVRHGSLSSAAQALGVNYTTVSRRIAHAEEQYGTRLFDRLPQGYVPTDAGREAAEFAERMESSETEFRLKVAGREAQLSGSLKVTAPQLLFGRHLATVLDQFLNLHPNVNLSIRASNEVLNLNRREADLAIRISDSPGDTLMGRRLTGQQTASFCTREVYERIEADPAKRVNWLAFSHAMASPLDSYPNGRIRLVFDDMAALLEATKAGLGVARLPLFLGREQNLILVPYLPPQPFLDIWVVAHKDLWANAKVVAFKELLVAFFRKNRALFEVAS